MLKKTYQRRQTRPNMMEKRRTKEGKRGILLLAYLIIASLCAGLWSLPTARRTTRVSSEVGDASGRLRCARADVLERCAPTPMMARKSWCVSVCVCSSVCVCVCVCVTHTSI